MFDIVIFVTSFFLFRDFVRDVMVIFACVVRVRLRLRLDGLWCLLYVSVSFSVTVRCVYYCVAIAILPFHIFSILSQMSNVLHTVVYCCSSPSPPVIHLHQTLHRIFCAYQCVDFCVVCAIYGALKFIKSVSLSVFRFSCLFRNHNL